MAFFSQLCLWSEFIDEIKHQLESLSGCVISETVTHLSAHRYLCTVRDLFTRKGHDNVFGLNVDGEI